MTEAAPEAAACFDDLDQLAVNTIRTLAMDAVQKANSGHPGMPMGAAAMAHALWSRHLIFDPDDPQWPNRDRFVLSAGHGSMLLYALLHLAGYDLGLDELEQFRQWGSRTPGHPERGVTPGVEVTTGPLGQGFANGVGMAIAEAFLAHLFNRPGHSVVGHYTFGIVSDGDLMEGVAAEAASLAGHLGLGRLIYLYDDNHITIEGPTQLAFTEDVGHRFASYGWHVMQVTDGNDLSLVDAAIARAKLVADRPSLIMVRTHIACCSPNKEDSADSHGSPLGADEVRLTKEAIGWPPDESFRVPPEVRARYAEAAGRGRAAHAAWRERMEAYRQAEPEPAAQWDAYWAPKPPAGWQEALPVFTPEEGPIATRSASGKVLNAIAGAVPNLLGGSADLAPSNNTALKDKGPFDKRFRGGRNLHFGVREHGMGAVLNGLALHGGVRPYGGTFLVFSDYMRGSIRVAALSGAQVVYVFTHDSVAVGEDGPTHQPIEHLAALRAMPGLTVIRPADANETVVAWKVALEEVEGPTALILSRQNLPVIDRTHMASADLLSRGAYIISEVHHGNAEAVIMASGSEVEVALAARDLLAVTGVMCRVVSFPSWELFAAQPEAYRKEVLPDHLPVRVAVEAAATFGWERWTGDRGRMVGIDRFGASAPGPRVMKELGITPQSVADEVRAALAAAV
ncbi:MAG: transketolase [Gaiellales bacterium]|nr:transketolase [Gaiellales bacterium]